MNASERRTIRQAMARLQTGDRSGAREVLAALVMPRGKEPDREQLVFAVVRFECPRLHVEMPVRECLEKRGLKWITGRRRGAPRSPECVGCETGEAFAWSCPGIQLRRPSEPPAVMPRSQALAKRARALVVLGPFPSALDPMAEASMLTPNDRDLP